MVISTTSAIAICAFVSEAFTEMNPTQILTVLSQIIMPPMLSWEMWWTLLTHLMSLAARWLPAPGMSSPKSRMTASLVATSPPTSLSHESKIVPWPSGSAQTAVPLWA